jgi:hypothetical protein
MVLILPFHSAQTISSSMNLAEIILLNGTTTQNITQSGIGLGSALAVVCSWHRNRSILWAILAGFLSWIYVLYFAMTRRVNEMR